MIRFFKAFSSEVDSGSRKDPKGRVTEYACKQETEAFADPIPPDRQRLQGASRGAPTRNG
jgi:hypothetical protein